MDTGSGIALGIGGLALLGTAAWGVSTLMEARKRDEEAQLEREARLLQEVERARREAQAAQRPTWSTTQPVPYRPPPAQSHQGGGGILGGVASVVGALGGPSGIANLINLF